MGKKSMSLCNITKRFKFSSAAVSRQGKKTQSPYTSRDVTSSFEHALESWKHNDPVILAC